MFFPAFPFGGKKSEFGGLSISESLKQNHHALNRTPEKTSGWWTPKNCVLCVEGSSNGILFEGMKQNKWMVILRDFPYSALFGLVIEWPLLCQCLTFSSFGHFQMTFLWLIHGGDPNHLHSSYLSNTAVSHFHIFHIWMGDMNYLDYLPPRKLTWILKIMVWKRWLLLNMTIFGMLSVWGVPNGMILQKGIWYMNGW